VLRFTSAKDEEEDRRIPRRTTRSNAIYQTSYEVNAIFGVKLWHSIRAVSGALQSRSGLEEAL